MKIRLMIILLCFGISSFAQTGFTTKTVSIFKNGAGFFIKEGTVQPKDKIYTFDFKDLPPASYGTFWLSNPNLKELKSYQKEFLKFRTRDVNHLPSSTLQLLQNNVDKEATLFLNNDDFFSGIIRGVSNELVILEKDGQWLNLPHNKVQWVILKDKPSKMSKETVKDTLKTNKSIVEMLFENNQKQQMDLVYFRNGIGWIPSYKVELISEKTARISMQAGVSNDAEDLKDVNLNLVVGFPNIKYSTNQDIFYGGNFNSFASQISNNQFSNVLELADRANRGSAVAYSDFSNIPTANVGSASEAPPSITGESTEDLYFYNLKNITLPKGGRAVFQVFQEDVPYEHIYEVRLNQNHNGYYTYQQVANNDPYRNKVWHTIKLKNDTDNAWTTGAAMVVKKDGNSVRPISQDDLSYTPMKGERTLKLTISPDISVLDIEKETNRVIREQQDDKYYYDIVTVKGTVNLRNYKDKDIRLDVKRTIVGNMKGSEPKMLIAELVNVNTRFNKTNEVCWEIELKAGEKMTIEYEYEVYVRR